MLLHKLHHMYNNDPILNGAINGMLDSNSTASTVLESITRLSEHEGSHALVQQLKPLLKLELYPLNELMEGITLDSVLQSYFPQKDLKYEHKHLLCRF